MATITKKIESARGCGYRKKGGIYLVSDGIGRECSRLPIPLTICPCCSAGIKPTRGFTWASSELIQNTNCNESESVCSGCPLRILNEKKRFGLLWVGEKFYNTTAEFTREAMARGVSRRIAQVPRDLEIGTTWILFAHRKAVKIWDDGGLTDGQDLYTPGIFHAFKPSRIEYIIAGNETEEELNALEKRGFELIDVVKDIDTQKTIFE